MIEHLKPATILLLLFTGLTGIAYPLAITGVAQVALPGAANGSLIATNKYGTVVGSTLIGQQFAGDIYFHGRPSAAGDGYNALSSSGSNYGPTSQKLLDRVQASRDALNNSGPVPADAVTASGSGLDPHISPQFAQLQVKRVAAARKVSDQRVQDILERVEERPLMGFVGEPRVNVLLLNLALDTDLKEGG